MRLIFGYTDAVLQGLSLADAKATPSKSKGPIKNQAYDEALDLSTSDTSVSHGNPTPQKGAKVGGGFLFRLASGASDCCSAGPQK